jgi:hypothetical protein
MALQDRIFACPKPAGLGKGWQAGAKTDGLRTGLFS